MAPVKPVIHGGDHTPGGADPAFTEGWHIVGDPGEPTLQNGTPISGYLSTRFRLVVGPPGTNVFSQQRQTLEVVINLDGVADGDTAFTLPAGYFDFADGGSVALHGHDSAGNYQAWHLDGTTGDVVAGV